MALNRFNKRQIGLAVLLLLTALAAVWPVEDQDKAQLEQPDHSVSARHQPHQDKLVAHFRPLLTGNSSTNIQSATGNLFPQQTWMPPPPPVVQQIPVAPPLPFSFAGRYTDGGNTIIFLTEGNKMHRVRQGEAINATYRLEKIEQSSVTFTYLPLGTSQILPTGVLLP